MLNDSNRRFGFGQLWLVLLVLSLSIDGSLALVRGQRRELENQSSRRIQDNMNKPMTNEPTNEPTSEPSESNSSPTQPSTSEPTSESAGLTSEPTILRESTPAPTDRPTVSPSDRPSDMPSSQPTMSSSVVPLPGLQFTLDLVPQSDLDSVELERKIENFLEEFLIKQYEGSFVSVLFSSDVNYNEETGVAIVSTIGSAVFKGKDQPDSQVLKEDLSTLFSYWGATDLQSAIDEVGYPILKFEVRIDGKIIAQSAAPTSPADNCLNPGLVAGVAAAGIACMLAA